jgi:glycosyltransferase involved in cell wall biosynthesis
MDNAARWFINQVFPVIKKNIPDIHFYIVGKGSISTLHDIKDDSITIVGQVDSVLPYLQNSNVAIVPLFFESGTRFKILEAGACHIPIVSTTLGAEGLDLINNKDIVIVDKPDEFACAVLKLILDKSFAKFIATNCNQAIKNKYSLNNLVLEGKEILKFLS